MIDKRINMRGLEFINSISGSIQLRDLNQVQIHTIISLQDTLNPYSMLTSREIQWKIPGKKSQGGNLNLEKFKKKFFDSKK